MHIYLSRVFNLEFATLMRPSSFNTFAFIDYGLKNRETSAINIKITKLEIIPKLVCAYMDHFFWPAILIMTTGIC